MNDPLPAFDPDGTLVRTPQVENSATMDGTLISANPHVQPSLPGEPLIPGYHIISEIAKGGMGKVYAAHHLTLDREVAIKTLLPGANAERFIIESKITAKLPHPNIPPVYELGTLADGTPFLAMKLVHGTTLAEQLKVRRNSQHELPRMIGVFEQIALAVGFAHNRGIIHRDLKPLNVMIGEFGEVQVMDWGLAKELKSDTRDNTIATNANADVQHTFAGSVMGTPGYMAPEQARGESVDASADVFALGALLAAILTGKPAFVGTTAFETIQKAAAAELDDVLTRVDASGADVELIALAKKCLAAERDARPKDGLAVAKLVSDYRHSVDERLKQAETERTAAEVRATETRKRQRALLFAGGVIAAVLLAGIGISLWQMTRAVDAERLAKTNEDTAKQNAEEAKQNTDRANAKTKEVQETLVIVQQRTKLAIDAYSEYVFGIQYQLADVAGTQNVRRSLLENARKGLAKITDATPKHTLPDNTVVWSHFHMGEIEQQLGNTVAAQTEYLAAYEIAKRVAESNPQNPDAQRDLAVSYNRLGVVSLQFGQVKEAVTYSQKSLDIAVRLAEADPNNVQAQRDLSVTYEKLGDLSILLRETQQAYTFYQKSLDPIVRSTNADPKNAQLQRDLSNCYEKLGDVSLELGQTTEALAFYQKSHEICVRLAESGQNNPIAQRDLVVSHGKLGYILLQLGQTKEALDFYKKSLDVAVRLVATDPKNVQAQQNLSVTYEQLGDISLQLGQTQDALAYYKHTYDIFEQLAEADPKNVLLQRGRLVSNYKFGTVSEKTNDYQAAIDRYEKAIAVAAKFEKPDFFENEVNLLKQRIADCKAKLPKPLEVAPAPREVK